MNFSTLLLLGTALALGLRHGIDWDHLAAITDISGSESNKTKAFLNGLTYALGHGLVIIVLGLLAILLGVQLPDWVDSVMEPVVGFTLVILGLWLLTAVIVQRNNFKLVSRWTLLFQLFHKLQHLLPHHKHEKVDQTDSIGYQGAFGVGMIHGIGAETPTQLVLFTAAAGAGGGFLGSLLVLTFVVGLIISNSFITLLAVFGFTTVHKNPKVYLTLGGISGAFSLIVGLIFLSGNAATLPAILGG